MSNENDHAVRTVNVCSGQEVEVEVYSPKLVSERLSERDSKRDSSL